MSKTKLSKPVKDLPESKYVDLSEGFDNFVTQKRFGMLYFPKIAVIQKPDMVMETLKEVIVLGVHTQGDLANDIFYICASEHFEENGDPNTPQPYTAVIGTSGVTFEKSDHPSVRVENGETTDENDNHHFQKH